MNRLYRGTSQLDCKTHIDYPLWWLQKVLTESNRTAHGASVKKGRRFVWKNRRLLSVMWWLDGSFGLGIFPPWLRLGSIVNTVGKALIQWIWRGECSAHGELRFLECVSFVKTVSYHEEVWWRPPGSPLQATPSLTEPRISVPKVPSISVRTFGNYYMITALCKIWCGGLIMERPPSPKRMSPFSTWLPGARLTGQALQPASLGPVSRSTP